MNKKLMAFLALLTITLVPSIAWAGVADQVYGLAMDIWNKIIGPAVLPYASHGNLGIVLSILCVGLTFYGFWRWEKVRHYAGKISGFGILPIALMIMWMIIGMCIGLALGLIKGGISTFWNMIPLINWSPRLVVFLSKITWYVVAFFLIIAVIRHLISQGFGYIKQFGGIVKDIITGPFKGELKPVHMAVGVFILTAIVNRPELNEKAFYAFSIAGSIFGVVQFFRTTVYGEKVVDRTTARVLHEPRKEDNAWKCPNCGKVACRDRHGNLIRKVNGKVKAKLVHCKGPIGKDDHGVEYGGWNPQDATTCMSPTCDYPNPFWQVCELCGYAGKDGKGFRRKPNEHVKCPKPGCHHVHPPLPKTTGFHSPDKDRLHTRTAGAPAASRVQSAPQQRPQQVIDGKIELDYGSDIVTGSNQFWGVPTSQCSFCGHDINPQTASRGCPNCGTVFDKSKAAPAPAVPRPAVGAVPTSGPPPIKPAPRPVLRVRIEVIPATDDEELWGNL